MNLGSTRDVRVPVRVFSAQEIVESVAELSCLVRRQPEVDIGQRLTGFSFDSHLPIVAHFRKRTHYAALGARLNSHR
jgi:hypothetical protein